jgi:hypothetical protein
VGRNSPAGQAEPTAGRALSRRKVFKRGIGIAAVAAVGGSVLSRMALTLSAGRAVRVRRVSSRTGQPVVAAAMATPVVETAGVAPAVVSLTDAATVAIDASQGNDFRLTIGGNRTIGTPANPANGQQIIFQITQGSGGSNSLTWSSGYEFSADLPQPTLSSAAGQTDLLGFIYNAAKSQWLLAAFVNGFS